MTTNKTLIYSIEAAKRIFNLKSGILKVQEWAYVVLVVGKNFSRFISKKVFKKHFADRRKQEAKNVNVIPNIWNLSMYKTITGNLYYQNLTKNAVTCTCMDYDAQVKEFGFGVCKHGYAVLSKLGYSSLLEYIKAKK